jgi:hypothetical protein
MVVELARKLDNDPSIQRLGFNTHDRNSYALGWLMACADAPAKEALEAALRGWPVCNWCDQRHAPDGLCLGLECPEDPAICDCSHHENARRAAASHEPEGSP